MKPNAINYLSLARKARRIEVGEEPVGACARSGHARLVLVASDAPDNTVRRARNFVAGTEQQMIVAPFTKDEMGAALGRTSVALAAMTDPAMALAFLQALEDPKRYGKAMEDLTNRTKRVKQHQQEEKAHERNLRQGKKRQEPAPKALEQKEPRKEEPRKEERKPFHGERNPEAKKEFGKRFSGKSAVPMRKSGTQGPRQNRFTTRGAVGRKTGRKTHGGAE